MAERWVERSNFDLTVVGWNRQGNPVIHAIGNTTICLPKTFLAENGINPEKDSEMVTVVKD